MKIKNILAIVILVCFNFNILLVNASEYEDTYENAAMENAVNTIVELGIMSKYVDGTFKPDALLTRAEAAKIICRTKGLGAADSAATFVGEFIDVDVNHWANGYINLLTQSGVAKDDYGDQTFRPDENIKISEFVMLLVRALGCEPAAENRGYMWVASKLEMLNNTTFENEDDYASRGNVALLVFNALSYHDTPDWEE